MISGGDEESAQGWYRSDMLLHIRGQCREREYF
jgi:hypothetical protein